MTPTAPTGTARSARGLLLKCALIAGIAALPVLVSVLADPARLVRPRVAEREIARALLAGHYVTDVTNYDDRVIQHELALAHHAPVDLLALGSSRVQPLSAEAFPGVHSFVNAGVSGASLDDVLAVFAPWDDPTRRPSHIVFEVDPWMLGAGDQVGAWGFVAGERSKMLERLGMPSGSARATATNAIWTLKRLASPEYFRLSLSSLVRHGTGGIPFVVTDRAENPQKTMRPDGSLVWMPTSAEEAESLARRYVTAELPSDIRYTPPSAGDAARAIETFERLLRHMRLGGSAVTVLLVPYHPLTWQAFARRADMQPLAESEGRIRAIAEASGASVMGSYDPAKCGFTRNDFFDESHARPDALARVVAGACGGK